MTTELAVTKLQQGVTVAAYEAHYGPRDPEQFQKDLPLFSAKLVVASTPGAELTQDEKSLAHVAKVTSAMSNVITKGLVQTPEEVADLTDALVFTPDLDPSAVLKYLGNKGISKLERRATPREIINALSILPDFEENTSVGRVIRAAELAGISLTNAEIVDDASIRLIAAQLSSVNVKVSRSTIMDDPRDGPVGRHFVINRTADTSGPHRPTRVNPAYSGEFDEPDDDEIDDGSPNRTAR